jgi:cystathionine gamma-synthase
VKIETLSVHGTAGVEPHTGALNQPLYLSTTFQRDNDGTYSRGFAYAREGNPNRQTLEMTLAQMEGGERAFCFSSGLAAISAMLQTLQAGDHVIFPHDMYFGAKKLMQQIWRRWNLQWSVVDMTDATNVRDALRENTKLIWIETPSNPLISIVDLAAIASIAREAGVLTACDNTLGTPVLQNPISFGIDVVMHSTTKYINGHSDIMGGVLIFAHESSVTKLVEEIQFEGGAVQSPFDCMMTMRGLQTMPLRVRAQCTNASLLSNYLYEHPAISDVYYPGLPSHPQHELAKTQMNDFGAMASIIINGDKKDAFAVTTKLKIIIQATSLGGTHSTIEHRHSVEGEGTLAAPNLLRMSFGIENAEDLKDDLAQALASL